jgi:hypothetical protein
MIRRFNEGISINPTEANLLSCCNWCDPNKKKVGKKHNSINYHVVREAVAAGVMRVAKEDTRTNPADALTKILRFDRKQKLLWPLGHLLISKTHQGTDGSGVAPE